MVSMDLSEYAQLAPRLYMFVSLFADFLTTPAAENGSCIEWES